MNVFGLHFGAVVASFRWFVDVFVKGVFRNSFWEPKKGDDTSRWSDFGSPGEGKGRGKPLPLGQKCGKLLCVIFVTVFFVALLRQPVLDARPRAGGLREEPLRRRELYHFYVPFLGTRGGFQGRGVAPGTSSNAHRRISEMVSF